MSKADDAAVAQARAILAAYRATASEAAKARNQIGARRELAQAKQLVASQLDAIAGGAGISGGTRAKIRAVVGKVRGHKPPNGDGAWWANSGGSSSGDPSSWI